MGDHQGRLRVVIIIIINIIIIKQLVTQHLSVKNILTNRGVINLGPFIGVEFEL